MFNLVPLGAGGPLFQGTSWIFERGNFAWILPKEHLYLLVFTNVTSRNGTGTDLLFCYSLASLTLSTNGTGLLKKKKNFRSENDLQRGDVPIDNFSKQATTTED